MMRLTLLCVTLIGLLAAVDGASLQNSAEASSRSLRKAKNVEENSEDVQDDQEDGNADETSNSDNTDTEDSTGPRGMRVTPAPVVSENVSKPAEESAEVVSMKAAEKTEIENTVQVVEKVVATKKHENPELEDAQNEAQGAQADFDDFNDDKGFQADNEQLKRQVTKETESAALATMMGKIRAEVREYAKGSYGPHLKAQVAKANARVKGLQGGTEEKEAEEEKESSSKEESSSEGSTPAPRIVPPGSLSKPEVSAEDAAEIAEIEKRAGATWAVSFFATVVVLSAVFAMASSKESKLRNYTWFLVDQVVLIFLAVLYFNAFDSALDFHDVGVHDSVVIAALHAVTVLSLILIIARFLQPRSQPAMAILCGAGAHISSFSSIQAAATAQNHILSMGYGWFMAFMGMCVIALALMIIGFLVYTAKKSQGLLENDSYMDASDDVENDFGSMAFSVVFTMFVRLLITGHHPVDDDSDPKTPHTEAERTWMLIWAIASLCIAGVVTRFCARKADMVKTYGTKRVLNFIGTVATMNVAWAFLYWGEWEFFDVLFQGEELKGKVMFAVASTLLGGLALYSFTKMPPLDRRVTIVSLTAISLVIAWSWEHCFDAAVEAMTDGVAHPSFVKVTSTLVLFCVVLPVYAFNIKPITGPAYEAIGA
jgi:hypothetical protein